MQLSGKAALISGAGGGICRAIALAFAEAGARSPAATSTQRSAAETARLVEAAGGEGDRRSVCDVAERGRRAARPPMPPRRAFGRLDILVSGAAPHDPGGTVIETPLAEWQQVLDINLTGSFLLSRAVRAAT